jgi:hypothetical protein
MPQIRVKSSTKARVQKLAAELLGTPGIEQAKYAGIGYVPADQVIVLAVTQLEAELQREREAKQSGKRARS